MISAALLPRVALDAHKNPDHENTAAVVSPFSGEEIARVPLIDEGGTDAIAMRAVAAFHEMRALSSYRRSEILRGIAEGLRKDHARAASLLAIESGKPIKLARGEIDRAIATFTLGAEEAKRMGGEVLPIDITKASESFDGSFRRFPIGPVLGIAPFNFAMNLVAHKVAPALAVGASCVLKPAPQTPLSALLLAEIVEAAGAPPHALQVVPASVKAAEKLVQDARFAILSFTGSDRVGFHLKSIAGKKRTLLELGGNAAAIIEPDVPDLDFAVTQLVASAFGYAGQVCIKTQRIFVHEKIAAAFTLLFTEKTHALGVARDAVDEKNIMGPLIDARAAERVESWIAEAKGRGMSLILAGERDRNYLTPTIIRITGDTKGLRVVEEEAFGPVVTIHEYSKFEDALAQVNASRFGLQAAIFTDSLARVRKAYDVLDVGGLIVNDATNVRVDVMPYGGAKDSGVGREGVRFAMQEMTDPKMLVTRR